MNRRRLVATALADALLAGTPEIDGFVERAAHCLGHRHRWIAPLARHVFTRFGSSLAHVDRDKLVALIESDRGFERAWFALRPPRVAHYFLDPPPMRPRTGALAACDLPAIATPGDLATWLGITTDELDWFADVRGMNPAEGPLGHYRYTWIAKSFGARLIEAPKARLRELQRRILRGILDRVPAHRCAHGFRANHSCRTFVQPHIGREIVLRMDLRHFFPGIPAARVHALFATLGYPAGVARLLTALCTNGVPMSVAKRGATSWSEAKRLQVPHLPQGAPTSPAIANLCALHLDLRLDALAATVDGAYSRYADDLAISGGPLMRRAVTRVSRLVATIATEEGFEVNHRKTRPMHRSRRQRLTGIVVNERPNVPRDEFDRLKAILTNCLRHGAASQNREDKRDFRAHLAGRIVHVASLNPARAVKLDAIYRRITWE
jgi:retron-type reverse transcriptase